MVSYYFGHSLKHLHIILNAAAIGALGDGPLLERFLAGRGDADSSAAFTALVERHGPMVRRVSHDVLGNLHDAEDASQATFLILACRAQSIRHVDSLASWLYGVALRVAAKARAQNARRQEIERRGGETKAENGDDNRRADGWPELHEEMERLPERYRAPIVLCHLEGLSNEQAAGYLGLPIRTVQRRLAQGRERLRARLVRRGWEPAAGLLGMPVFGAEAALDVWLDATVQAAAGVAAGRGTDAVASATVTGLTQGVLKTMLLGRLKTAALGLMATGALVAAMVGAGAAIAVRRGADHTDDVGTKAEARQALVPQAASAGPWIKGLVVDSSGKPVMGAQVTSLWTVNPRAVTTKSDGTFVLANDEPRLLNLSFLATADGGARQGIFRFQGPTGSKDARTLVRIVLKPARTVTVTVVDGQGIPVDGAEVFGLDVVFPIANARTDARGVASLRAPADTIIQWIFGYKPSLGFDYFENYRTNPPAGWPPPPERARLVLDGTRAVRIRAVDSAGNPMPGVELVPDTVFKKGKLRSIQISASPVRARTDQHGSATFDWLPRDVQSGTSFLVASSLSYLPKQLLMDLDNPDAELIARVVKFTPISGKVTLPDGSPAPGIRVAADGAGSANPGGSGRVRTSADGSYTMDVPPEQSYMVYVVDDEWAARSLKGIVVRERTPQTGLDLRLERASVITGRVTTGSPSKPASGLAVILVEHGPAVPPGTFMDQPSPLREAILHVADTDRDGRYAFHIGSGDYQLTGPSQRSAEAVAEHLVVSGGQQIQRDFQLSGVGSPWRTLCGTVRAKRPDGPRIAGAIVVGDPIGARDPESRGSADERGRFELPRPFGKIVVYVRNPEGDLAGCVTVGDDDDAEVTIVAKHAATARGQIVDSAGKPRSGVNVICGISVDLEGVESTAGVGLATVSDSEGRFTVPGLPVGARCRLYAANGDAGNSSDRNFLVKDTGPIDIGSIVLDSRGSATPGFDTR